MAKDYVIPRFGVSKAADVAGYLREAAQEGDAWLATQKPAAEWESIINRIGALDPALDLAGQSNAIYNKMERVARELVAGLGAFEHVGEIKPAMDASKGEIARILTKIDHHWTKLEHTYTAHRQVMQNMVALGTGYGWQTWDKHFHGHYKGDVRLQALSPAHVTFVQLPNDHDIQRAYIVLIREEIPINLARRIYGRTNRRFAELLTADRDAPSWIERGLKKVQAFLGGSPVLNLGRRARREDSTFPVCDIYHAYIMDDSINETGEPMQIGPQGTNWSYTVPTYGGEVQTALINPATGQPWTRPADHDDCLLFPLRRYCVFSRNVDFPCYDGTSPWWHGQVPLARFSVNDWPWEALGRSAVGMIRTMEASMTAIMQGVEDSLAARLDPPAIYDDTKASKGFAEAFNPRRAGSRAAADLSQGDILKFPVAPQYYDVPNWITDYLKFYDERCEYLTGARDMTAVAKAKQLPSSDAMEKLLEMAGPLVQDMVRAVIMPHQQLGQQRLALYFQFYTYDRVLQQFNNAGEEEDWQFQPTQIVPVVEGANSPDQRAKRARTSIEAYTFRTTQSGVSEINRMSMKLFYMNLMKLGSFPLDWWTFAKIAQIPNFGDLPKKLDENGQLSEEVASTVLERWLLERKMLAEIAQEEGGGQPGQKNPRGRPQTNARAPHMVVKQGGRSTVATS